METTEKQAFETLATDLKTLVEKANEQAKTAADGATKVAEETKAEVKTLATKMADSIAELEKKYGKLDVSGGQQLFKPVTQKLEEELKNSKEFGLFQRSKKGTLVEGEFPVKSASLKINEKAAGIMGSSTNLTGSYFVPPQILPGQVVPQYNPNRVRNFIFNGNTTSDTIRYVEVTGGEGTPAMVGEGGAKPLFDKDLAIKDSAVRKIAGYMRVPEEMIEDIPYLVSLLTRLGSEDLMDIEDAQLLYGTGTGNNLKGLTVHAQAFANAYGWDLGAGVTERDVIIAAIAQVAKQKFRVTAVFIDNGTYYYMQLLKDSTGRPLYPEFQGVNGQPVRVGSALIIPQFAMTDGEFLAGDLQRGAALFDRAGMSIRFYDQDQDNAIKNLVTIVMEERLALVCEYPKALSYGVFSTAKPLLNP